MQLKVWVDGSQRVVCGVRNETTCKQIVYALAQATHQAGRFTVVERWHNNERFLSPDEQPLVTLQRWGDRMNEVEFVMRKTATTDSIQNKASATPATINNTFLKTQESQQSHQQVAGHHQQQQQSHLVRQITQQTESQNYTLEDMYNNSSANAYSPFKLTLTDGHKIDKATEECLLMALVNGYDELDTEYVDDFLILFRVFLTHDQLDKEKKLPPGMTKLCYSLLSWLDYEPYRDKVIKIVLTWLGSYYQDFELNCDFSYLFFKELESKLVHLSMNDQLLLLHLTLSTKSRVRNLTITRSSRDQPLNFTIAGGYDNCGIFVLSTDTNQTSLRPGDQIIEVNGTNFTTIKLTDAQKKLDVSTHLSLTVKYNPSDYYAMQATEASLSDPSSSKSDQTPINVVRIFNAANNESRYIFIHEDTTAREVVMLAVKEFNFTGSSSDWFLYEVSVVPESKTIKQKLLAEQTTKILERSSLSSRFYIKNATQISTNGPTKLDTSDDSLVQEILKESPPTISLTSVNATLLAVELTLIDFDKFKVIEPQQFVYDTFYKQKVNKAIEEADLLNKTRIVPPEWMVEYKNFAEISNKEMFWVICEILNERNLARRVKIVKQFIRIADVCLQLRNYNSMFAIISGLGHSCVGRLKRTFDKLKPKYKNQLDRMRTLFDPSRNMANYRLCLSQTPPPGIPLFPQIKKDLTFTKEGRSVFVQEQPNYDSEGNSKDTILICFAEIRRFTERVSNVTYFSSVPYSNDLLTYNKESNKNPAQIKKMYEEWQMRKRIRHYIKDTLEDNQEDESLKQDNKVKIDYDERVLYQRSLEVEPDNVTKAPSSTCQTESNQQPQQTQLSSHQSSSSLAQVQHALSQQNHQASASLSGGSPSLSESSSLQSLPYPFQSISDSRTSLVDIRRNHITSLTGTVRGIERYVYADMCDTSSSHGASAVSTAGSESSLQAYFQQQQQPHHSSYNNNINNNQNSNNGNTLNSNINNYSHQASLHKSQHSQQQHHGGALPAAAHFAQPVNILHSTSHMQQASSIYTRAVASKFGTENLANIRKLQSLSETSRH